MADSYVNTSGRLNAGELATPIKLSNNNLSSICAQGSEYVNHLVASSPIQIERMFGVKAGAAADLALSMRATSVPVADSRRQPVPVMFAKGEIAYDTEYSTKVTVHKHVGYTVKGNPIYRVVDRHGNTWKQSERKLRNV